MRMLRWALDSAASDNHLQVIAGIATLTELLDAELLQDQDEPMVRAIAEIVLPAATELAYSGTTPDTYTESEIETQEEG